MNKIIITHALPTPQSKGERQHNNNKVMLLPCLQTECRSLTTHKRIVKSVRGNVANLKRRSYSSVLKL